MQQITGARVTREPGGPWVQISIGPEAAPTPWRLTLHDVAGLPPLPFLTAVDLAVDGTLEEAYEAAEAILTTLALASERFEEARLLLMTRLRQWTDTARRAREL